MLARIDKAHFLGKCANLLLGHFTERKNGFRKLPLSKRVKHIALILVDVASFFQQIPVFIFIIFNRSVVTCHNAVKAELLGALKKLSEFYKAVAVDAGVWSCSCFVRRNKPADNFFVENIFKIVNIVGNAQL